MQADIEEKQSKVGLNQANTELSLARARQLDDSTTLAIDSHAFDQEQGLHALQQGAQQQAFDQRASMQQQQQEQAAAQPAQQQSQAIDRALAEAAAG
jgi:hypothetical protein